MALYGLLLLDAPTQRIGAGGVDGESLVRWTRVALIVAAGVATLRWFWSPGQLTASLNARFVAPLSGLVAVAFIVFVGLRRVRVSLLAPVVAAVLLLVASALNAVHVHSEFSEIRSNVNDAAPLGCVDIEEMAPRNMVSWTFPYVVRVLEPDLGEIHECR